MAPLEHVLLPLLQVVADSAGPRLVVERGWLDTLASVAQSLVSILVMVMLVVGVLLLYALRRSVDELTRLIRNSYEPLRAAIGEAREVTGEVRTLARSLKAPVLAAGATLDEATDRFRAVMDVAEDRLARLDALVEIAQSEAEGAVVGAASLLRGVRAGGAVMQRAFGKRRGVSDEHAASDEGGADVLADASGEREVPRIRTRATTRR